jgi:hypothetical protein
MPQMILDDYSVELIPLRLNLSNLLDDQCNCVVREL